MTVDDFEQSLRDDAPPEAMPPLVRALWYDRRGDWTRVHEIAQDIESTEAAWVHAYLHRREGDASNATYWYRRSGKPIERGSLDDESRAIVANLLRQYRDD